MLHADCEKKLKFLVEPLCKKCGAPVDSDEKEYCTACRMSDRGWDYGRSVFSYHGAVGKALRQVKQEGTREFVQFFAKQVKHTQKVIIQMWNPECLVPVPLHPLKLRKRGFNQAELLAFALEKEMQIPVRLLLKKERYTKDQKRLNKTERKKNVKNAFCVDSKERNKGIPKSVLLIDDVSTTGSTLSECAKVLKKCGVQQVTFISICVSSNKEEGQQGGFCNGC